MSENHSKKSKAKIPQDEEHLRCAHSVPEDVFVCVGDVFSAMVSGMQSPEDFFCQPVRNCRKCQWDSGYLVWYSGFSVEWLEGGVAALVV